MQKNNISIYLSDGYIVKKINMAQLCVFAGEINKYELLTLGNIALYKELYKRRKNENYNYTHFCYLYCNLKLKINPNLVILKINDKIIKIYVDLADNVNPFRMIYEIIIKDQYDINYIVNKKSNIIDAGANYGIFSLYMASKEANKIYAYEPDKKAFRIMENNLKLNEKLKRKIKLFNIGLGDKNETKIIQTAHHLNGSSTYCKDLSNLVYDNKYMSNIKTIDSLKLTKISLIKADVEGYEKQIIKGAKKTIQKYLPYLTLSAYHYNQDDVDICNELQKIANYETYITNKGEKVIFAYPWVN